jgi:hypothetical protein
MYTLFISSNFATILNIIDNKRSIVNNFAKCSNIINLSPIMTKNFSN